MSIKIHGIGLSGYRSFHPEYFVRIGPFKKMNFFIGPNNVGKSNVLKFIHRHYGKLFRRTVASNAVEFSHNDSFKRESTGRIRAELGVPFSGLLEATPSNHEKIRVLVELFRNCSATQNAEDASVIFLPGKTDTANGELQVLASELDQSILSDIHLRRRFKENFANEGTFDVLCRVHSHALASLSKDPAFYIPQFRQIGANEGVSDPGESVRSNDELNKSHILSGDTGIFDLAKLQNPGHERISSEDLELQRKRYLNIQDFFCELVGDPKATLQANFDRNTIIVDVNGRVDTLESLGTGIHQVILLAIIVSQHQNSVFCIEEPETHMHPTLIRRLIDYLDQKTSNQYFISTHSSALIDAPSCAVFGVQFDEQYNRHSTKIQSVNADQEAFRIVQEMGYRPSDLLQSNCVIWVEGPSDRIYLRDWISRVDTMLKENGHYSFVIYGGGLKSYLDTSDTVMNKEFDEEQELVLDEFIKSRMICRQSALITDRDLPFSNEGQNKRNEILEKGFKSDDHSSGFFMETLGRTIENYIPVTILKDVLIANCGAELKFPPGLDDNGDWWIGAIKKKRLKKGDFVKLSGRDKVKLAEGVIAHERYKDVWNSVKFGEATLHRQIEVLCNFIRKANGLPALRRV